MKKLLLLLVLLPLFLHSQQIMYSKVYHNPYEGVSLMTGVNAFDGGYLFAGAGYPMPLVKLTPDGLAEWRKDLSGVMQPKRMIVTLDSGYFLVGSDYYSDSVFCLKLLANGDISWTKMIKYGLNVNTASVADANGTGFLIIGNVWNIPDPSFITLTKLDPSGNLLWSKKYNTGIAGKANSVNVMANGNILLSGISDQKAFISMLTQDGEVIWTKKYISDSECFDAIPYGTQIAAYIPIPDVKDIIARIDHLGNVVSSVRFPGSSRWYAFVAPVAQSLHAEVDGSLFWVAGGQLGNIVKIDSTGQNIFYDNLILEGYDALKSADGGYLIYGSGPLFGVKTFQDPHSGMIKTDSQGLALNCLWNGVEPSESDTISLEAVTFSAVPFTVTVGSAYPAETVSSLMVSDDCVDMTGSVNEKSLPREELRLIPNPAGDCFQPDLTKAGNTRLLSLQIIDGGGTTVLELNEPSAIRDNIDISALAPGMYIVKLVTEDKVFVGRMVKR